MAISNPLSPTTVLDFSGGETDNVFTAAPNCSGLLKNFWLDENGKPYTRYGMVCFPNIAPASTSYSRISGFYIGSEPFGSPVVFIGPSAYYLDATDAWQQVNGIPSLTGKGNSDLESSEIWQRQLISVSPSASGSVFPNRIYCDILSPVHFVTVSLGLPVIATPTVTSSGGSGFNYLYAFHYYYSFTDWLGTEYVENGPHVQVEMANVGQVDVNNINITNILVLTNSIYSNWDVSTNLKVKIFRTQNNGSVFYNVAIVNNGTTTYTDVTPDLVSVNSAPIYTDGGVLDWYPPPTGSQFVVEVNDFFWYATDREVTHSIQGAPGACPLLYIQPTAQKIKGLGSIISFPVLFCDQSIYRLDGTYDELGNGGFQLREISQTAGLISNRSIVSIPGGLVFAGNGGFYFTDGYQVQKISDGLNQRYQIWASAGMCGCYDPIKNLVHWAVNSSGVTTGAPNDTVITLHLNFGINRQSTFTTSVQCLSTFVPTAIAFTESADADDRFQSRLLFGTADGYFMYLDPNTYTDPHIDHNNYPVNWTTDTIIYRYESTGMNLGDEANRKYAVEMTAEFQSVTDLAVQFITRRDDGGAWGTLSEIRSDGAILWGISDYLWGDTTDTLPHNWDSQPLIEGKRGFPAGTLRASRRQIGFTNSYTQIARSDDSSTAFIDPIVLQAMLTSPGAWPEYCEGYFISFLSDGYTNQYLIKSRVSDTILSLYDPSGTLPGPVPHMRWQIAGYRKNEIAKILSYTVFSDLDGTTQAPNRGKAGLINGP